MYLRYEQAELAGFSTLIMRVVSYSKQCCLQRLQRTVRSTTLLIAGLATGAPGLFYHNSDHIKKAFRIIHLQRTKKALKYGLNRLILECRHYPGSNRYCCFIGINPSIGYFYLTRREKRV